MTFKLTEDQPIYIQVKNYIEDSIINETIKEGDRVPSTNEFAKFYKINPATAAKGVNELVADEILWRRRGVGMFVQEGARDQLLEKRKQYFYKNYILPLNKEAKKLQISREQLIKMIREGEEGK